MPRASSPPRFRLRDHELTRTLMQHTGDGTRVTVRDLADAAGVHPSFIGKLILGDNVTVSADVASGIAGRIGVDLLVLWVPVERATRTRDTRHLQQAAS